MLNDVYYNPEHFGLTKIAEHDLSEPDYSFDLLVAWKNGDGIFLGTDSGCSCPSPFESFGGVDDLTGPLTVDQAVEEATSIKGTGYGAGYDLAGFADFISAIREAV